MLVARGLHLRSQASPIGLGGNWERWVAAAFMLSIATDFTPVVH